MNILVISQAFPPHPVVGSLRVGNVVRALESRGHSVTVITGRLPEETGELRPNVSSGAVHAVKVGQKFRLWALELFRKERSGTTTLSAIPATTASVEGDRATSRRGTLSRMLLAILWFPDDEQRFVLPAARLAARVMKESAIDVVYTSGPPHSTHLVGLWLKFRYGVRWVSEYRDPWTDQRSPELTEHWFGPVEALHRLLERKCLRAADGIIAVTESAGRGFAAKLPSDARCKVSVALNGLSELPAPKHVGAGTPLTIAHVGSCYGRRNPLPLLRAIARMIAAGTMAENDIRVVFAGGCERIGQISVADEAAALGLLNVVGFRGWVSHDQAMGMMREAGLLLLLATGQPMQVPNKLYDYLASGTPILAVVDEGGESERILESVGGHYVVRSSGDDAADCDAVRQALESAIRDRERGIRGVPNVPLMTEMLTSRQLAKVADAIEALGTPGRAHSQAGGVLQEG